MELTPASYRVLIVDDEAIQRTGIVHLCDWSEYKIEIVGQASNGQEALQLIEDTKPHVVITDIVMPMMDGVELTKAIRSLYPDIKMVVLSSYSEFEYVREVFKYGVTDYLLKPKVSAPELIALIQELCSGIALQGQDGEPASLDPSLLLAEWLDGDAREPSEDITQHYPAPCFRMMKTGTSLLLSRTNWTQSQLEQRMVKLAAGCLSPYSYSCVFLKNELLLLVNYEPQQADDVRRALTGFAEQARAEMDYIAFVLSAACHSLDEAKSVNERLTASLGKLVYFPESALVPDERIAGAHGNTAFDQAKFIEKLQQLAIDEAIAMLKALISDVQHTKALDEYSLKRLCQNIIYSALTAFEQLKMPEPPVSKLKLFKKIDLAFDINELDRIMTDFLEGLRGLIRSGDQQQPSVILQQVYNYVDEHYAHEISLADMAAALHVNYSYLSSYFKQRTQENLTSYINRIRINKAKELLKQDLSISEISRLTGYSDHNYFSKVFKKYTGLTPVEYRTQTLMTT